MALPLSWPVRSGGEFPVAEAALRDVNEEVWVCVWVCVRGCSRRLRQEWPRQGSSCNLQPMFIVQQCRGRGLASLRTTPLSRCYSRNPSSPPLSTSTQCHHHTIAPNWPLHQYWSSAAPGDRSISQTFPLAQPMVQWSAGLPLRWLPPLRS
jgi:hypothetical protein